MVRTFWETHKIWKNLPYGFYKSADLLSKCQNHEEDFFKLRELLKKSVGMFLNMFHLFIVWNPIQLLRSITQNFQNGISNCFHFVLWWSFSLNSLNILSISTLSTALKCFSEISRFHNLTDYHSVKKNDCRVRNSLQKYLKFKR